MATEIDSRAAAKHADDPAPSKWGGAASLDRASWLADHILLVVASFSADDGGQFRAALACAGQIVPIEADYRSVSKPGAATGDPRKVLVVSLPPSAVPLPADSRLIIRPGTNAITLQPDVNRTVIDLRALVDSLTAVDADVRTALT